MRPHVVVAQWSIEPSELGRIVVPPSLPAGFALFYTTIDFEGHLNRDDALTRLMRVVRDRFGIDATLTTCVQIHGKSAVRATRDAKWRECDACDALWSSERGVALGIKIADCLPVSIVDPRHHVIANIHSGWRGAVQNITGETVDTLAAETGFDVASAHAYLGPSIRACCFEVGEEVVEQFRSAYRDDFDQFVDRTQAKPHIDLVALTAAILDERGFAAANIHDSGLCTRCGRSLFHSFRRDPKRGGRNLAIAVQ